MSESNDNPAADDGRGVESDGYATDDERATDQTDERTFTFPNIEQGDRIASLQHAKELLLGKSAGNIFATSADVPITDGRIFVHDLIKLAEYIQNGLLEAEVEYAELPLQPHYPYNDGEFTVFGPGGFYRSDDESVLNLNGHNYILQGEGDLDPEPELINDTTTEEN